ncbi:MAG: type II toxin-antitoxin system RelE/ParE family toxin [Sphingomonadales bacterium]|nr:type II toxin-antitoxin system RelE/ParE family toxin [Sphingomonadales bacterium]
MKRLSFHAAASADMRRIATDTRARWGKDQAAAYSAILRDDIKSLLDFPLRFPEFEGRRKGLRRMNSGSHSVFYLVSENRIEIISDNRRSHRAREGDQGLESALVDGPDLEEQSRVARSMERHQQLAPSRPPSRHASAGWRLSRPSSCAEVSDIPISGTGPSLRWGDEIQ